MDRITNHQFESTSALPSFFNRLVSIITSEASQKIVFLLVILNSTLSLVFIASLAIYLMLYLAIVPNPIQKIPIHLNYNQNNIHSTLLFQPLANQFNFNSNSLSADNSKLSFTFSAVVPDSPQNLNSGNFMIEFCLHSSALASNNNTIHHSNSSSEKNSGKIFCSLRPGLIEYKSPLFQWLQTLYSLPSLLLGFSIQAQKINVVLLESYEHFWTMQIDSASLSISNPSIQTYSSNLEVQTHFSGLVFFMYNWPLVTGSLFVALIMLALLLLGVQIYSFLESAATSKESTGNNHNRRRRREAGAHGREGEEIEQSSYRLLGNPDGMNSDADDEEYSSTSESEELTVNQVNETKQDLNNPDNEDDITTVGSSSSDEKLQVVEVNSVDAAETFLNNRRNGQASSQQQRRSIASSQNSIFSPPSTF